MYVSHLQLRKMSPEDKRDIHDLTTDKWQGQQANPGQKHFQAWKMGSKYSKFRSPSSTPREWNKLSPDWNPPAAAFEGQGSAALEFPREKL